MPYKTNKELPSRVKNNLSSAAQTIYRKAFNNASKQYKSPAKRRKGGSPDTIAARVAWSAVKKVYKKRGGRWIKK